MVHMDADQLKGGAGVVAAVFNKLVGWHWLHCTILSLVCWVGISYLVPSSRQSLPLDSTSQGIKQVKTVVSGQLIDSISAGELPAPARALQFAQPVSDKVERHSIHLFELTVTERQAQSGFAVSCISPAGSRFKLMLWDEVRAALYPAAAFYLFHDSSSFRVDP